MAQRAKIPAVEIPFPAVEIPLPAVEIPRQLNILKIFVFYSVCTRFYEFSVRFTIFRHFVDDFSDVL